MMKQILNIVAGVILFVTSIFLIFEIVKADKLGDFVWQSKDEPHKTEMKKEIDSVVELQEPTSIYIAPSFQSNEKLAVLNAHTQIQYKNETKKYYEIEWNNITAYIKKTDNLKQVEGTFIGKKSNVKPSVNMVTSTSTAVYQEPQLSSKPIMTLQAGWRIPVERKMGDWYIIRYGGQIGYVNEQDVSVDGGIAVLMYHHIVPEKDLGKYKLNSTTVTAEAFEEQMTYLHEEKFTVLTKEQLIAYVKGQAIVSAHAVLITFDDGLLSTKAYAYPILKRYNMTAIQHIISARKDRVSGMQHFDATVPLQFMTDEEMKDAADVFQYEAHTFNMHSIDSATKQSRLLHVKKQEFIDDLRQNLEDVQGATAFAYPFGQYNEENVEALKEVGIEMAFTTERGLVQVGDDIYQLKRYGPDQKTTLENFINIINN